MKRSSVSAKAAVSSTTPSTSPTPPNSSLFRTSHSAQTLITTTVTRISTSLTKRNELLKVEIHTDNYLWKSTNIGSDRLEIHPTDDAFTPGTYSVGVYAYKPGLNTFKVRLETRSAAPMTDLPDRLEQTVNDWNYYRFPIDNPGESRLEVVLSDCTGPVAMFASPHCFYPTEDDHHWSSVSPTQGYYDQTPLPANPDMSLTAFEAEHYQEVDPFDTQMKRIFVKKGSDRELDPCANLSVKTSFEDWDGRLVLCVDTEDWKYSTQTCYLAVRNMSSQPVSYVIQRREVLEEELLSEQYLEQFRLFKTVYEEVEGSSVSQAERRRMEVSEKSEFTYGEVEFAHMIPLLELCNVKPGEVFWDLGCGAGKCLLAVSLLYPGLKSCNGIEFLPMLHELCQSTLSSLSTSLPHSPIKVLHGDMLTIDWSNADLIFTSSICFPEELMTGIYEKALLLKVGTRIMTLKSFPVNDYFEVKFSVRVKMTWGKTGVYILEKVR